MSKPRFDWKCFFFFHDWSGPKVYSHRWIMGANQSFKNAQIVIESCVKCKKERVRFI